MVSARHFNAAEAFFADPEEQAVLDGDRLVVAFDACFVVSHVGAALFNGAAGFAGGGAQAGQSEQAGDGHGVPCAAGLCQGRALVKITDEFEDVLALEVAMPGDAVCSHEIICVVSEDSLDLSRRPDEELSPLAFAVGVLC